MVRGRSVAVFLVLGFSCLAVLGEPLGDNRPVGYTMPAYSRAKSESLSSASVAQRFCEIAYEQMNSPGITGPEAEQAIIFLLAAKSLDEGADYIDPLLIKLACRQSQRDYSAQIIQWLAGYVTESIDLDLAKGTVRYLVDRLNSREERENILVELVKRLGGKNKILDSELETLLGLLMLEKGDTGSAKSYLIQAYENNRYNSVAFARLAELLPDQVSPAMYLEHLRLVLRENPLDIQAALNLAEYSQRLQLHEMAAAAYQYCAQLYEYLYPGRILSAEIYLPWAISCYNTQRGRHVCLQIAERIRSKGKFDILLEAIAGRAAGKMGNAEEANRIFEAAEEKARRLLELGPKRAQVSSALKEDTQAAQLGARHFAWFYCFAREDTDKALDWANRAYSTEPNSPAAASLLAYALLMNNQLEWAKPLIFGFEGNQVADLVQAQIGLSEGRNEQAIELLRRAINKDPGSLVAERAKDILSKQGAEYMPPVDPDVVLTVLANNVGKVLVPQFVGPDKILSVQFNIQGNEFSYGGRIGAVVAVINNSSEPLIIGDDGLVQGNIRIDARVSGDIKKDIPYLVSRKISSAFLIEPGRGALTSVSLVTGELRRILATYPQASLNIEFTLYIDPAVTDKGIVSNRLTDIKPIKVAVTRPGIELTGTYLRNRFNSISTGQEGQRIKTAQLFVGLLKEQYAMAEHGTLYKLKYADWMPELLRSALVHESGLLLNPADGDWVVKVHTMAEMISLPLDQELAAAVSKNLNNSYWPVRLMTVYLLAGIPDNGFRNVLDWVAQYDANEVVRSMAVVLGAAAPQSTGPKGLPAPVRLKDNSSFNTE